jgi:hypothetical protein
MLPQHSARKLHKLRPKLDRENRQDEKAHKSPGEDRSKKMA